MDALHKELYKCDRCYPSVVPFWVCPAFYQHCSSMPLLNFEPVGRSRTISGSSGRSKPSVHESSSCSTVSCLKLPKTKHDAVKLLGIWSYIP